MLVKFVEGPSEEDQVVGTVEMEHCPRTGEKIVFDFVDSPAGFALEYLVIGVRWQVDIVKNGGLIKTVENRYAGVTVELERIPALQTMEG